MKGDKRARRAGETAETEGGRGWPGGGRRVLRPSAKNGFLQERLSKLSPAALSNHGLHYELPRHPSLRWAAPGQGRHKAYGDSSRGGWAGHLWAVCWSLGPERCRKLVWRISTHTHKEDRVDSGWRPQRSWRSLGTSLELASKKRPARLYLVAQHPAGPSGVPGLGAGGSGGTPLQRRAFGKTLPSCTGT